jgi:hypothetical protein
MENPMTDEEYRDLDYLIGVKQLTMTNLIWLRDSMMNDTVSEDLPWNYIIGWLIAQPYRKRR